MKISDETLMMYADGELEPAERHAVEAALSADPDLGRRVTSLRAQRTQLADAYRTVLEEPVPERLRSLVERALPAPVATATDLRGYRLSRQLAQRVRQWSWPEFGAVAASVLLGIVVALEFGGGTDDAALRAGPSGIFAGHHVAKALSTQLAGTQSPDAPVQVGLTFENQAGQLCRTFAERARQLTGVACRTGDEWRVDFALAAPQATATGADDGLRTAGSAIPPAMLKVIEERIRGEPFDSAAEARARDRGWRPEPRSSNP